VEEKEYLSIKETAQLFGVSRKTVEKWIRVNKLHYIKQGRIYFILIKELGDFLESKKIISPLPAQEGKDYWTIKEFASDFQLHRKTVEEMIGDGTLPAKKIGREYHVPYSWIEQKEKEMLQKWNIHQDKSIE
jgi:excisionase family DNA binding protein